MKFKAVLFDLDGTLLDTLEDLAEAMNYALEGMNLPVHPAESYKYFVGDGIETETRRALPADFRDENIVRKIVKVTRERYGRCWTDNTVPYPGIAELLNILQDKGIKLAVLSNKPDDFTKIMVNKLLPEWKFEIVRGANPQIPMKPNPAGALQIAGELGIQPQGFIYIGDTNTDMQTANAAGMYAVGALWGFRKAKELLENGAKILIETPLEMLKLFETGS